MKINEVPQDNMPYYYEKLRRGCLALDDEGKYCIVPSIGWEAEEIVNGLAVDESRTSGRAGGLKIVAPQRGSKTKAQTP